MPALVAVSLLVFAVVHSAQQPEPKPRGDAEPRSNLRATDDLRRIEAELQRRAHAYTGSCRAVLGHDDGTATSFDYSGARRDGIDLLRFGAMTRLEHGDHQLQRTDEGPWTKPQGDMPDCPLAPHRLAHHLLAATVQQSTAVAFDDRPAQRLHVVWEGPARLALLADLDSPDPKAAKLVERLPDIGKKMPAERFATDATVVYDPASRTLYAATLRIALLNPDERPADAEPLPSPPGMPSLPRQPLLECTFQLRMQPTSTVPWPELDAATRQRLQPAK